MACQVEIGLSYRPLLICRAAKHLYRRSHDLSTPRFVHQSWQCGDESRPYPSNQVEELGLHCLHIFAWLLQNCLGHCKPYNFVHRRRTRLGIRKLILYLCPEKEEEKIYHYDRCSIIFHPVDIFGFYDY